MPLTIRLQREQVGNKFDGLLSLREWAAADLAIDCEGTPDKSETTATKCQYIF